MVYLCHLWLGVATQLYLTEKPELCYQHGAQYVHIEKYNYKSHDTFDKNRLSAICGWSYKRCPILRS